MKATFLFYSLYRWFCFLRRHSDFNDHKLEKIVVVFCVSLYSLSRFICNRHIFNRCKQINICVIEALPFTVSQHCLQCKLLPTWHCADSMDPFRQRINITQYMGTKNSNISKCNSIAILKFLNVCTVFVNTETGMVCLCTAQCSLNVFNSACLMWHYECRTLTSICVTLPTLFKKMHKTCAWRTMSFNMRFFIYFFAIEILLLSSICSRIFCRLFDFAFFCSLSLFCQWFIHLASVCGCRKKLPQSQTE